MSRFGNALTLCLTSCVVACLAAGGASAGLPVPVPLAGSVGPIGLLAVGVVYCGYLIVKKLRDRH
jgi:hypothetical protein